MSPLHTLSHVDLPDHVQTVLQARRVVPPAPVAGAWTVHDLRDHLQFAVDVEHYTIPYYMAAWFSIRDQAAEAARLIKTVVNQEMLHLQCAANLLNAFGGHVKLAPPIYDGIIPHLDFALDDPDPTTIFSPWSAEIGPLDTWRLNTMCIIEYPEWTEPGAIGIDDIDGDAADDDRYGSIGALYHAIAERVRHFGGDLEPGRNQVDLFGDFYPDAHLTVTAAGDDGLDQVDELMQIIVTQGEGQSSADDGVPERFQNQADDLQPAFDHYDKFTYLRGQPLPEVYDPLLEPPSRGADAQRHLLVQYADLLTQMTDLFRGGRPDGFATSMFSVGAAITECWRQGVVPAFGLATTTREG